MLMRVNDKIQNFQKGMGIGGMGTLPAKFSPSLTLEFLLRGRDVQE